MKYFGTDGIRQPADKFTSEFIASVIKGLSDYASDNAKVLIAGDTRESTEWILADLESALETFGLDYGNAGVLPTPAINWASTTLSMLPPHTILTQTMVSRYSNAALAVQA